MTSRSRLRHPIALATLAGAIVLCAGSGGAAPSPPRTDTLDFVPPEVHPRAAYGSFEAACDSVEQLLRSALGSWADSATFERGRVTYAYRDKVELFHTPQGRPMWELVFGDGPHTVTGLRMTLHTTTDEAPGHEAIERALDRAGWVPDVLAADGHGGRSFDMVCREAVCIVDARWDDPGDIEDSTYVAAPGERIEITCVPRPPGHPYRRRAPE